MKKILLFAGTTEGRLLWEYCLKHKIPVTASVATEYGESVLSERESSEVLVGRMDGLQIEKLLQNNSYALVIDATHPYAKEVTNNIRTACQRTETEYIRIIRESLDMPGLIYVNTMEEAAAYLNLAGERALITTGSKEIRVFTAVKDFEKRLTVRILPDLENIRQCMEAGFKGCNLICMQGPFSEEFNFALLKEIKASYLVTKEAGAYGGFLEKVRAAKKAGVRVIVIRRPKEEAGYTLEEVQKRLLVF